MVFLPFSVIASFFLGRELRYNVSLSQTLKVPLLSQNDSPVLLHSAGQFSFKILITHRSLKRAKCKPFLEKTVNLNYPCCVQYQRIHVAFPNEPQLLLCHSTV